MGSVRETEIRRIILDDVVGNLVIRGVIVNLMVRITSELEAAIRKKRKAY